jgi:hypothetical protein
MHFFLITSGPFPGRGQYGASGREGSHKLLKISYVKNQALCLAREARSGNGTGYNIKKNPYPSIVYDTVNNPV